MKRLWFFAILFYVTMLLAGAGCKGNGPTADDWLSAAKTMEAMGVEGELILIWGNGHVAGQSFNLSGSSGFGRVKVKPDSGNQSPE
ncbi:MAG: hypothetical protein ABIH03_07090 [Pseudomonadota bacterium]